MTPQTLILTIYNQLYQRSVLPLILRFSDPQDVHERVLWVLERLDNVPLAQTLIKRWARFTQIVQPTQIGSVTLQNPMILAAGFVKGKGFESEAEALAAVEHGENIIMGWRTMPALVGAVEFGSFTRYPRMGNTGRVIWRDADTYSTQNRIGLKNPGAMAAARFLAKHPPQAPYGINIAVSPGVDNPKQEAVEIVEAAQVFLDQGIRPNWFTLNLSCPNTEDDPLGNQSEAKAERLTAALQPVLNGIPLWVKVSPCLSEVQYEKLMLAFAKNGIQAVIATNTLGQPTPEDSQIMAGVGGGALHEHAVAATHALQAAAQQHQLPIQVIGCGGVLDGNSYRAFGTSVNQYWGALIYRGIAAPSIILQEAFA